MKEATRRPSRLWLLSQLLCLGVAFHLGTLYGATMDHCEARSDDQRKMTALDHHESASTSTIRSIPSDEFLNDIPLTIPRNENQKLHSVAILHNSEYQPQRETSKDSAEWLENNCENLMAVSIAPLVKGNCLAVVQLQDSPHVHHFRHIKNGWKSTSRFPSSVSLSSPPKPISTQEMEKWLVNYLSVYGNILDTIRPIASKIATKSWIVVMVCNAGHGELLLNFVCAAKKIGVDMSNYLVFATDEAIMNSAKQWGLTVIYHNALATYAPDEDVEYGSKAYAKVMMSKVQCAHLISSLGYDFDFVFLDVDIVPYRSDFLERFLSYSKGHDMVFQYDHSEDPIYQPWSANSGFYFVRSNQKTRNFFSSLVRAGDMILRSRSHQAVLNILLGEHVSLYGLKVRVLAEESNEFPVGYHFNKDRPYMKALIAGKISPYAFHMNWNNAKEMKIKFNQQLGDWHLLSDCNLDLSCCAAEPTIVCHFQDKPSRHNCGSSPFIEDDTSFW